MGLLFTLLQSVNSLCHRLQSKRLQFALSGSASIRASPDVLGIKVRLLKTNLVFKSILAMFLFWDSVKLFALGHRCSENIENCLPV